MIEVDVAVVVEEDSEEMIVEIVVEVLESEGNFKKEEIEEVILRDNLQQTQNNRGQELDQLVALPMIIIDMETVVEMVVLVAVVMEDSMIADLLQVLHLLNDLNYHSILEQCLLPHQHLLM